MSTETVAPQGDEDVERILASLNADEPSPTPDTEPSVPDAQPVTDDGAAPANTSEPTDPAQATADPSASPAPATDPTPPEGQSEPFAFVADGKRVPVEGARVVGDEIRMPRDVFNRNVQPYLADRARFTRERQQYEQRLSQRSTAEQQSAALLEQIQGIAAKSDEEVVQWALNLKDRLPLLLRDAEIAALRQQRAPLEQHQQQEEQRVTEEQVTTWADTTVHHFLQQQEFADVRTDPKLVERVTRNLHRAIRAGEVLREGRDEAGQPSIVADWDRVKEIIADEATIVRERQTLTKRMAEIDKAAQANAAKLAAAKAKQIPPAVTTAGKPTGAKADTKITNRDEYEARLERLARFEE